MASTDPTDDDPERSDAAAVSDDSDAVDSAADALADAALDDDLDEFSAAEIDCLCRATGVVDLLSRKYAIPVLCALATVDTARFGDFEDLLADASTSTLSARLDEIVDAGLATRTQYDEIPPRVEYELTADGRELGDRLQPLVEWAVERE